MDVDKFIVVVRYARLDRGYNQYRLECNANAKRKNEQLDF